MAKADGREWRLNERHGHPAGVCLAGHKPPAPGDERCVSRTVGGRAKAVARRVPGPFDSSPPSRPDAAGAASRTVPVASKAGGGSKGIERRVSRSVGGRAKAAARRAAGPPNRSRRAGWTALAAAIVPVASAACGVIRAVRLGALCLVRPCFAGLYALFWLLFVSCGLGRSPWCVWSGGSALVGRVGWVRRQLGGGECFG